jgi:hypothetical protein
MVPAVRYCSWYPILVTTSGSSAKTDAYRINIELLFLAMSIRSAYFFGTSMPD